VGTCHPVPPHGYATAVTVNGRRCCVYRVEVTETDERQDGKRVAVQITQTSCLYTRAATRRPANGHRDGHRSGRRTSPRPRWSLMSTGHYRSVKKLAAARKTIVCRRINRDSASQRKQGCLFLPRDATQARYICCRRVLSVSLELCPNQSIRSLWFR